MNLRRVILAGLLAGLLLNLGEAALHAGVLADTTAAAVTALGRDPAGSNGGLASLIGITFVQGVLGLWLVALLMSRPMSRGAAAVIAGLVLWFLSAVYAAIYLAAAYPSVLPDRVVWLPVGWDLIEYPLAIFVGALAYRTTR